MCGDGYCCKYAKGCFCSHYECYELCSHGDLIFGKSLDNRNWNGGTSTTRAEKSNQPPNPPIYVLSNTPKPKEEQEKKDDKPADAKKDTAAKPKDAAGEAKDEKKAEGGDSAFIDL